MRKLLLTIALLSIATLSFAQAGSIPGGWGKPSNTQAAYWDLRYLRLDGTNWPVDDLPVPDDMGLRWASSSSVYLRIYGTPSSFSMVTRAGASPAITPFMFGKSGTYPYLRMSVPLFGPTPLSFEGATTDSIATSLLVQDPTSAREITVPDASGHMALWPAVTADAALQFGAILMVDAGTNGRFDVNGADGALAIGVLAGDGPSAQDTAHPVATTGASYILMVEDKAVTRGHVIFQSASVAGRGDDQAGLAAAGKNIGRALYSEAVSATINPTGCTGGAGCINTALDTPNTGAAGMITLGVDVAALGWAEDDPVAYYNSGGTTPTGLTDGNVYWLLSVSTTNVTVAATKGGTVVVPSTQGDDGTQYLQRLPLCVINIQ